LATSFYRPFFKIHDDKRGIILFSGVLLFQLVTLPVEFNASRRAFAALRASGLVSEYEIDV
jgi:hypothetical protein